MEYLKWYCDVLLPLPPHAANIDDNTARAHTTEPTHLYTPSTTAQCQVHGKVSSLGLATAFRVHLGEPSRGHDQLLRRAELASLVTFCGKLSSAVSLIERYEMHDKAGVRPAPVPPVLPLTSGAAAVDVRLPPAVDVAAPGSFYAEYMASRSHPSVADQAAEAEAEAAPAVVISADDGLAAVIYAEFASDVSYAEAALTAAMSAEYAEFSPDFAFAEAAPAATFAEAASAATNVQDLVAQLRGMPPQHAPEIAAPTSGWARHPPARTPDGMPWSPPPPPAAASSAASYDGFFEALDHDTFRQVRTFKFYIV